MTISELRQILNHLKDLYLAAGAKGPAKDLQIFSEALKPYASKSVTEFCVDTKGKLDRAAEKSKNRKKAPGTAKSVLPNEVAVRAHLGKLRAAGTDREAFDAAFGELKADKSIRASDVAAIARQYSDSVTKYKSISAAHVEISKAFVRQARFENKVR